MRPDLSKVTPEVKNVLNYPVNTIAKMMEEHYPNVWQRMFTKSIDAPGNYYSSKSLAVALTGAIVESKGHSQLESNVPWIAGILEKYDFPTYYVSEPLITALKRTKPPEQLKWKDIMLPFPSLVFMLPRGSLKEPENTGGQDLIFVGVAKVGVNQRLTIPTLSNVIPVSEERICVFWAVGPSAVTVNDTTFPSEHPLEPVAEWINEKTEGKPYFGPVTTFSVMVAGLVASLILVMEARKELVEPGICKFTRNIKRKVNLWSPTFIGRNYSVIRKELSSHEARAGHFRRQHFGPKSEQVKTIFIDPYIAFTRGLTPN